MRRATPGPFKDRLSTTDESGRRIRIMPAAVKGKFQRHRDRAHVAMIAFFLLLPWLKVNGYPALQLDVPHRRFFLAGQLFLAQDIPGVFFIVASFVILLILISALWGRFWCGWACPHTVFIEGFFRRAERWVEGHHLQQRELDRSPWTLKKIRKKTLKWSIFTAGSMVVTHSFLAYFVGADNVLHMVTRSPLENPGSFTVVVVSTAVILFDFGWFREQFCLIACPYGRFQSAMMDEHSLTVAYDSRRGEPRRNQVPIGATQGDCIDCFKCVNVCPTGIDIRNGFQMECIACTACIDACDEVMQKIGKPTGLVRYASEAELKGQALRRVRPRTVLYALILIVLAFGLVHRVLTKEIYQTEIVRAVDAPYQLVRGAGGQTWVINHFNVNWYNLSAEAAKVEISMPAEWRDRGFELIQSVKGPFDVPSGQSLRHQFFIKYPVSADVTQIFVNLNWSGSKGAEQKPAEIRIVGPESSL